MSNGVRLTLERNSLVSCPQDFKSVAATPSLLEVTYEFHQRSGFEC